MASDPYADLTADLEPAGAPRRPAARSGSGYDDLLTGLDTFEPEPTLMDRAAKIGRGALSAVGAPARGLAMLADVATHGGLEGSSLALEAPPDANPYGDLVDDIVAPKTAYKTTGTQVADVVLPEEDARTSYGKAIGREVLKFGADLATDPLTYAGFGAGLPGKAAGAAFTGLMAHGSVEAGKSAYDELMAEGWSPDVAAKLTQAVLEGGGAALGAKHLLSGHAAPVEPRVEAPAVTPEVRPVEAPVVAPERVAAPPVDLIPPVVAPPIEAPPVATPAAEPTLAARDANEVGRLVRTLPQLQEPDLAARLAFYERKGLTGSADAVRAEMQRRQPPPMAPEPVPVEAPPNAPVAPGATIAAPMAPETVPPETLQGPTLGESQPTVQEPPQPPVVPQRADPAALDRAVEETVPAAITALSQGQAERGGKVFAGTEHVTTLGTGMHAGKVEFGLEDMPEGARTIAAALKRDKGNPIELRAKEAMRARLEEQGGHEPPPETPPAEERTTERRQETQPVDFERRVTERRAKILDEDPHLTGKAAERIARAEVERDDAKAAAGVTGEQAVTDPVTNLMNFRGWEKALETVNHETDHVAIVDIRGFKPINDKIGHAAGNDALQNIGLLLKKHFGDETARQGGDEFGAILRNTAPEKAAEAIEAFRSDLKRLHVPVEMPDGSVLDIPGFDAHIGVARHERTADLAQNAERERVGSGREAGAAPDLGRTEPAAPRRPGEGRPGPPEALEPPAAPPQYSVRPSPGQRGLPGLGEDVAPPREKTKKPEQSSMFGGEMLQSSETRTTEGREGEGALFTKDADARARAEKASQADLKLKAEPAVTPPAEGGLTLADVRKHIRAPGITETPEGFQFGLRHGGRDIGVFIDRVGDIHLDPKAFASGRPGQSAEGLQAVGSYQRVGDIATIKLLSKVGETPRTLLHEHWHLVKDLGLLNEGERKAIEKKYGANEEAQADAYADWNPAKRPDGIFGKIASFFRNIYRSFKPSAESAFEKVRSGKVFEGKGATAPTFDQFADRAGAAYATAYKPSNPFAAKAERARAEADRLNQPTSREKSMEEAFPLGAGFGHGSMRSRERGMDASVNRSLRAVEAERNARYLEAQAQAFDAGQINAQGRSISAGSAERSAKSAASKESRHERIAAAKEIRGTKEPWEVTRQVYADASGQLGGSGRRLVESDHGEYVAKAVEDGKTVPAEVLADYPDLSPVPKYATAPKAPPQMPERKLAPIPDKKAEEKPLGRAMEHGEAPRVEKKVAALEEVSSGADLSRNAPRTWESLDPEIRKKLGDIAEKPALELGLYERARTGRLNDVEVQTLDALVTGKRESYDNIRERLLKAQSEGRETGPENVSYLRAALDRATAELALAARSDVEAGTKLARALAARARVMDAAGKSTPDQFLKRVFRQIEGVSDAQAADLLKIMQERPQDLGDALIAAMKPTTFDKFLEGWKNGLVSAPGTLFGANPIGNIGEQIVRLGETATASLLDPIFGGPSTRLHGEARFEFGGAMKGVSKSLGQLGKDLRDIVALAPEKIDLDHLDRVPAISGKTGRAIRIPYRLLTVVDDFFKGVGGEAELHKLAWREAGGNVSEARRLIANPTKEMLDKVGVSRLERTFQNPDKLVNSLITLRSNHKWLHGILPFLQTPTNLAKLGWQRSPAGFYEGYKAWREWKSAVSRGAEAPEIARLKGVAVDKLARPLMGTMIMGSFYAIAKAGGMTGSGPTDPKDRNALKDSGWQPYSFAIPVEGGKHLFVPFNRFEPVSTILGIAADAAEASEAKSAGDLIDKGLGSVAQNFTSKTFLSGLSDAASMISDPKQFASQYVSGLAGSLIPNIVAKGAQEIDPTVRDTKASSAGLSGIPERIAKTLASRIPGASFSLAAKKGSLGEDVERPGNAWTRFLSPVQPTVEKDNADLTRTLVEIDAVPSAPKRDVTIPNSHGKKVRLTDDEYELLTDAAKQATESLRRVVSSSGFQRLDEDAKRSYVRRVYDRAETAARQRLWRQQSVRDRARAIVRGA